MEQLDIERRNQSQTLGHNLRWFLFCCAWLWLIAGSSVLMTSSTLAQEPDEAGIQLGETLPTPTAFTEDTSQLSEEQRLVLVSIRQTDPITPQPIIRSAQALHDLQLYRDVRFLLDRLDKTDLSDEQWYEVIDRTGSMLFLDVYGHPNTQPEGRRVSKKILSAVRRASRSQARISRLIANLSSDDRSAARTSLRKLESIGEDAVAELVSTFADGQRKGEFDSIRDAIDYLGQASPEPLVGAARASDPSVKLEAIRALSTIDDPSSTEVMMWSSLAPNHSQEIRQIAQNALLKRGIGSDANTIEERFFTRSYRYLRGTLQAVPPIAGKVNIWRWNANTKRMVAQSVDPATATQLVAARHAVNLYDINPTSVRNRAMFVLTQLESIQRLAGPGKNIDAKEVMAKLGTNAREIDTLLAQAVRLHLYPAGVACCQILKENPDSSLMYRLDGKPSSLVQAITSGDRYLQFAAFEAIQAIGPKSGFMGSSFVLDFAVNVSQSNRQPIALIAHPDPNTALTYAGAVNLNGLVGMATTSGHSLFEIATTNPDVEVILLSDKINYPRSRSLIRQLRNDWRTREVPIGLLYTDVDQGQRLVRDMESDKLFAAMPFSTDPKLVETHLARLLTRIRPYRVTQFDRQRHAQNAIEWLAKIAENRREYRFYNLARHEEALNGLLFQPGLEALAAKILASLGTPSAQRQLVDFASQTSLPVESRKRAVNAFSQSLKNRGTMLTSDQIQKQYDRYNASAKQPKSTQEILGAILDAIEANRGR